MVWRAIAEMANIIIIPFQIVRFLGNDFGFGIRTPQKDCPKGGFFIYIGYSFNLRSDKSQPAARQ